MLDIIGLYDGLLKTDDLEAIVHAIKVFEASGYQNHELQMVEITAIKDLENDNKAEMMYQLFYEHVDTCLMEFGIRVNREGDEAVSLNFMVEMLDAMLGLDDPEMRDFIAEALDDTNDDPAYVLADLLSEFMDQEIMEIYTALTSVDISLIQNLRKLVGDPDLHEDTVELQNQIRGRYLGFVKENRNGLVYQIATRLLQLPASRNTIMEEISEQLSMIRDADVIAFEVFSLALLSGSTKETVLDDATHMVNEYVPENEMATVLELRKLNEAYNAQA